MEKSQNELYFHKTKSRSQGNFFTIHKEFSQTYKNTNLQNCELKIIFTNSIFGKKTSQSQKNSFTNLQKQNLLKNCELKIAFTNNIFGKKLHNHKKIHKPERIFTDL